MAVFDPSVFDDGVFETATDLAASGSIVFSGTASLQLTRTFDAAGTIQFSGTAALTTVIPMAASGSIEFSGSADLFVARNIGRLVNCGDPVSTMCQDWLLAP